MNEPPGVGERIGSWTIVGDSFMRPENRHDPSSRARRYTPCRCDCGTEHDIRTDLLVNGRSMGCRGCRYQEAMSKKKAEADAESQETPVDHWWNWCMTARPRGPVDSEGMPWE